jgi:putative sterol carrier protein
MPGTVKEMFDGMFASLPPEKIAGIDADIQVDLAGEGGGSWIIHIANGKVAFSEGKAASPRLTLTSTHADLAQIVEGKVDPMTAYMKNMLKIAGDTGLAIRLISLFQRS